MLCRRPAAGLPIVIGLCLIGLAAESASGQQAGQQVAEGLGLTASQADSKQQQWPLEQLERIKSEARVSATVGHNAILNCAVQFRDGVEKPFVVNWLKYPHKLPIYIWYAGYPPHVAQGYESRVSRLGPASLNLSQVREQDQGLYECKIYYLDRRPEDKANGTWIYLDVQAPPRFTRAPAPLSYAQAGDSLRLECAAESTPAPLLRWYKLGEPGGPQARTPIEADALGVYRLLAAHSANEEAAREAEGKPAGRSQLELVIENVQAGATAGDYACLATNSEGSVEARAQVALAVPAVIVQLPRNQTKLEGDKAELECQARALPANITYRWLFDQQPLAQLKRFESRYSVRRDGTLVIHALHRDDQGTYRCQASNGLAHKPSGVLQAEAAAYLSVEFPARIAHTPPVQYLPLGLSGQIQCHVQAAPPLHWSAWTLNEQQFDPNADPNIEVLRNGSLLVRQVSRSYAGRYRCTAFNKHGSAGSSGPMEVRVEEPPRFELRPAHFYKANLNGQVRIPCEAAGSPKPALSWRRPLDQAESVQVAPAGDQQPTVMQQQHYAKLPSDRSEYKDSHLLLSQLRKEDHGRYECVIENEVATLVAATMLYIEETTPHAPTSVQVETRAWSAQVSWTPGYDGGFEQTYVIWYRQVERPKQVQESTLAQPAGPPASLAQGRAQPEPLDLNWRSVGVQPADATSFQVQNLSQDTSYEFCVRAKNIIGEGPRSQVVAATTKRAVSGSLAPLAGAEPEPSTLAAAAAPDPQPAELGEEDELEPTATVNPALLGIIHLVEANASAPELASSTAQPEPAAESGRVIKIYLPAKQQQLAASNGSADQTSKRAQPANHTAALPAPSSQQADQATAPQNVSMSKVAQGWVLAWAAPERPVSGEEPASSGAYSVEFREKGAGWQSLASSRERSLLLKDLKPGAEYQFRVYALAGGARSPPSPEFRYLIPDNRRKPGSTQALSAGVVSGVLFFIACIVIAVCAVNMCNKRRKKRAEKAAYVMMACPVLESHQDLAALNSNSLVKKGKLMLEMNSMLNPHLHLAAGPTPRKVEYQV